MKLSWHLSKNFWFLNVFIKSDKIQPRKSCIRSTKIKRQFVYLCQHSMQKFAVKQNQNAFVVYSALSSHILASLKCKFLWISILLSKSREIPGKYQESLKIPKKAPNLWRTLPPPYRMFAVLWFFMSSHKINSNSIQIHLTSPHSSDPASSHISLVGWEIISLWINEIEAFYIGCWGHSFHSSEPEWANTHVNTSSAKAK